MIRITCPGCKSKLNAKDELLGQKRKCPKCGAEIVISVSQTANVASSAAVEKAGLDDAAPDTHARGASETTLKKVDLPERIDRNSYYLICDKSKLVATWENNGQGWMLKTSFGLVSASRNFDQLPAQGDFKLVELRLDVTDEGKRLRGIRSYQLAQRWALTELDKGDDQIIAKIADLGFLNKEQKSVVRNAVKEHFMRHVWENAGNVLDYLGNTDYHSPGAE